VSARGWLVVLIVVVFGVIGALSWRRLEGTPPEIRAPEAILVGAEGRSVPLELVDHGAGLRGVTVVLAHAQGEATLFAEELPGSALGGAAAGGRELAIEIEIDPSSLPARVEDAFLRISARDWSWRDGLRGNEARREVPVSIDRRPPQVRVATGLTYVRRGGAGVVVYSLSEPAVRDGVVVGDSFFPSFPWGEQRVVVYAVPTGAPPNPRIQVEAEDAAGNVARARWPVVVNERELPKANITLPESFLNDKVLELAHAQAIDAPDPAAAFKEINTELRRRNEERIRELLADSAAEKLWDGPFEQLENSQVTSRFAEQRTYFVEGQQVSQATHFGYDLASTRAAPVTASAAGRVVFADDLGIYGNCVLLDHGLGVATLYGHLSRIDVAAGQRVEQGQTLGLSGATGLAGGDHLHFAILVGGEYVDPLEWWDPKWMGSNVEARLAP